MKNQRTVLRCAAITFVCALCSHVANAAERPNIVLIFIDDMGWKDVGCYGNDFVETPRIHRLA